MSPLATLDFFRYHGVWSPGVRLFRRMRFVGKAAVICAVFLLVLAQLSFLFLRASNRDVEKSERELAGLAVAREVTPLFNRVQQLRGRLYEAGGQHGNELKALLGEIESGLAKLEARTAQGSIDLAEPMKFVRQSFEPLKTPGADPQEAFGRADEFAQQLQRLLISVADLSGLSMDPDQPAYHLALASTQETQQILEMVGRVRDLGSVAIARKEADAFSRRIVQGDTYVLYRQLELLFARYERVTKDNAELDKALGFQQAFDPVNAFMRTARKTVLPDSGPKGDAAAFAAAGTAAMESLAALTERSQEAVGMLVSQRIDGLKATRNLQLSAIAVGIVLAAYLFYCFYLVTRGGMQELTRHIEALAAGDLTTTPRPWGGDEAADVMKSVHAMQVSLRALIGEVRDCANEIVTASTQVSAGAEDLSHRTETAAGRLQQTASTMDTISRTVKDTAQRIVESADLGQDTARSAGQSQKVIGDVVSTMQGIQQSSRRVADILGVIDGIAFQTNILALNAAVEAARAGEHGRGFAVVASEVRALAQRSAAAAKEIKGLISESSGQTEHGTRIVHAAGQSMDGLLANIESISGMLMRVREATEQQTQGVGEVSASVAQLDHDTQRNAALVEQTSAAALSMKGKAEQLAGTAARFVLPEAA
ncbi:MAG: HAMP domain-containing protein [Piscinibacter sp.]|jgi:methyl-accepting chemotaxis protein|nr:HAMP domain-containing protein [Piscinibacter sp.]